VLVSATAVQAQTTKPAARPWEHQVYFGEQHLHTRNSPDAFAAGCRQSWDATYEYAMGREVTLSTTASFEAVRDRVVQDLQAEMRQEFNDEYVANLLSRYEVIIAGEPDQRLSNE